jgi:hypothetical protein
VPDTEQPRAATQGAEHPFQEGNHVQPNEVSTAVGRGSGGPGGHRARRARLGGHLAAHVRPTGDHRLLQQHDLDFYGTHISIRPDPDTTRAANGFGNHGDCWFQLYQTTGQSVYCPLTGSYSNQWSSGSDVRTGVGGYVNWCYLEID